MKKCNKCQRKIGNPQVSGNYYEITEYYLKTSLDLEKSNQFYCCQPCWYHGKESEKYLGKPYYDIWNIKPNISEQLQQIRHGLIEIYKEMEAKNIKNIDLEELEELQNLRETLKMWGPDAPINQQNKSRREELERKYSGGSQNNNNNSNKSQPLSNRSSTTERERERESNSGNSKSNYLPWILGGVGIFAVIAGLVWYFRKENK